ncbi:membrane hypothetical protein [Gammaproteobacteria bacterium]
MPEINEKAIGLTILAFNAIIGMLFFHLDDSDYFSVTTILACISALTSIYINRDNILYLLRTVIIAWVGLIPVLAIIQDSLFSARMIYVQTREVGWIFSIVVCSTLLSSQIGFVLASKIKFRTTKNIDLRRNPKLVLLAIFLVIIFAGSLVAQQRGSIVFYSAYASAEQSREEMSVQNLQAVCSILLAFSFIIINRVISYNGLLFGATFNRYSLIFAFEVVYVTIWTQFLRGARMDPLGIFLEIFVLYKTIHNKEMSLSIKQLLVALLAVLILQAWGIVRTLGSAGVSIDNIVQILNKDVREIGGVAVMYYQGTFNDISVGTAGIINAVQKGLVGFWYGESYLDFILRIPPSFLYPERPKSLAWLIEDIYNDWHGGGINEMGEIFLNFGIYGSLFVPAIISFIIGWSYRRHLSNPLNIWVSLPFIGILALYIQGLLYQTFNSFRAYTTIIVIYSCLRLFYEVVTYASEPTPTLEKH